MYSEHPRLIPRLPAKLGAALMALWGVLHVWVGAEGSRQFATNGARGLLSMFLGGQNAPADAYQHATDAVTMAVNGHLALNFVLDVGAAGLLGLGLAWLIWRQASWSAYWLFVVIIGVIDNAFLFTQVASGLITRDAGTLGGPLLWLVACVVTPFGLRRTHTA